MFQCVEEIAAKSDYLSSISWIYMVGENQLPLVDVKPSYMHTKIDIHTKLKSNGTFINSLFRLIHGFLSQLISAPTSLMYSFISSILHHISLKPFSPLPWAPFLSPGHCPYFLPPQCTYVIYSPTLESVMI